jgi:signal transduction histidine kinase
MASTTTRLVPRRWAALPARSARLRLTLLYSGMFLVLGTAVIAIIFFAVRFGTGIEQVRQAQAVPGAPGGTHVISVAVTQRSADLAVLLVASWITLAVTAAASAPLGWFAAGRVLRPLREMTDAARAISAGNLHQRLSVAGPDDEFKQLGDTVDDLLARLEGSFAAQRRFVANAAHELRTPLTLERTLLQVALADPHASATTLRAACDELLASGRSQERLLESLLTLATSERGLERRDVIDLTAVARDALERAAGGIEHRQLELHADLAPATIVGDQALVARLVGNLIDNALRYNRPGGIVDVETATESGIVTFSVANDGPPVPTGEMQRLFEPFQRLQPRRTASDESHGLGLSIVRAIATAHGAEVRAEPRAGGGLVVTIGFPASE